MLVRSYPAPALPALLFVPLLPDTTTTHSCTAATACLPVNTYGSPLLLTSIKSWLLYTFQTKKLRPLAHVCLMVRWAPIPDPTCVWQEVQSHNQGSDSNHTITAYHHNPDICLHWQVERKVPTGPAQPATTWLTGGPWDPTRDLK